MTQITSPTVPSISELHARLTARIEQDRRNSATLDSIDVRLQAMLDAQNNAVGIAPAPQPLTTDELIALVPTTWSDDEQQEAMCALLEARPATADAAETIARRARFRLQHVARRSNAERMPEGFEPAACDIEPDHTDADLVYDLMVRWLSGTGLAVLIERYVHGRSIEETAERLGVNRATVVRHTRQAIDTLRTKARTATFRANVLRMEDSVRRFARAAAV